MVTGSELKFNQTAPINLERDLVEERLWPAKDFESCETVSVLPRSMPGATPVARPGIVLCQDQHLPFRYAATPITAGAQSETNVK